MFEFVESRAGPQVTHPAHSRAARPCARLCVACAPRAQGFGLWTAWITCCFIAFISVIAKSVHLFHRDENVT